MRLSMGHKAARGIAAGMFRYTATHPGLEVHVISRNDEVNRSIELGDWHPDGLITEPSGVRESDEARAVVFIHTSDDPCNSDRLHGAILCDNAAAGRMAAELLVRHNLRNFGYVGAMHRPDWSKARGEAFASSVARAGLPGPEVFSVPPGTPLAEEQSRLGDWLMALPKPCGIFVATDWRARHVLEICRVRGIAVPELAQVVGVDNEEYVCEQTVPPLTSIEPDFEVGGYEAIRMLDAMLSGRRAAKRLVRYGMRGVVERRSTRDDRGTARIVNLALDFIRRHATSGATAAEAVRAAGCSASLLQRYFKKALGRTVVQEIQRVRLEKACHLLRHTDTPINEIGALCGYGGEAYFKILFRRATGMTMGEYRRRRAPPAQARQG